MSDVNHRMSKTLVEKYGKDTLFVLEDLTGVSFEASNLSRGAKQNYDLRSWSFYQLEPFQSTEGFCKVYLTALSEVWNDLQGTPLSP